MCSLALLFVFGILVLMAVSSSSSHRGGSGSADGEFPTVSAISQLWGGNMCFPPCLEPTAVGVWGPHWLQTIP